jgi:hypothetical protein
MKRLATFGSTMLLLTVFGFVVPTTEVAAAKANSRIFYHWETYDDFDFGGIVRPFKGDLKGNDNTKPAVYSLVAQPTCGNVEISPDGKFTFGFIQYRPHFYYGHCTFEYRLCVQDHPSECATAQAYLREGLLIAPTGVERYWQEDLNAHAKPQVKNEKA